jgi:hypothetical protein
MSGTVSSEVIKTEQFEAVERFAEDYLRTFFMGEPTPDDQALIRFLIREYQVLGGKHPLLEIGCGPVVNHVLPAVPYVTEIHMADLREDNLEQVWKWVQRDPAAHDWYRFTRFTLIEEGHEPTAQALANREEQLRQLITSVSRCDLRKKYPMGEPRTYPAVACFYTTEQASANLAEWREVYRNLCSLVAPGGYFFNCAVGNTDHCILYDREGRPWRYQLPVLETHHFVTALEENGFDKNHSKVVYQSFAGQESEGVFAVILVSAKKMPA